jgi:hypothetical protein
MAERTLEEILVNLRRRVAHLERRGATRRTPEGTIYLDPAIAARAPIGLASLRADMDAIHLHTDGPSIPSLSSFQSGMQGGAPFFFPNKTRVAGFGIANTSETVDGNNPVAAYVRVYSCDENMIPRTLVTQGSVNFGSMIMSIAASFSTPFDALGLYWAFVRVSSDSNGNTIRMDSYTPNQLMHVPNVPWAERWIDYHPTLIADTGPSMMNNAKQTLTDADVSFEWDRALGAEIPAITLRRKND